MEINIDAEKLKKYEKEPFSKEEKDLLLRYKDNRISESECIFFEQLINQRLTASEKKHELSFGIKAGKILWVVCTTIFSIILLVLMGTNFDTYSIENPKLAVATITSVEHSSSSTRNYEMGVIYTTSKCNPTVQFKSGNQDIKGKIGNDSNLFCHPLFNKNNKIIILYNKENPSYVSCFPFFVLTMMLAFPIIILIGIGFMQLIYVIEKKKIENKFNSFFQNKMNKSNK